MLLAELLESITLDDATKAAVKLKIDWSKVKFTVHDLLKGMREEMKEHGNKVKQTDVIPNLKSGRDNPLYGAKIALVHLKSNPKYYNEESISEMTGTGAVAGVTQNLFSGPVKRKKITPYQKQLMKKGHGRKIYECGHMSQCRCMQGHELPIQEESGLCFDCQRKIAN